MEFFGEDIDGNCQNYSRRMFFQHDAGGSTSRESFLSEEEFLDSSGNLELRGGKEESSLSSRRKQSSRRLWEKRIKKCQRSISAI